MSSVYNENDPFSAVVTEEIAEEKVTKRTIFEIMKLLFTKQEYPTPDEIQSIPPYLMVTWLSNSPRSLMVARYLDSEGKTLPIEMKFKFAYYAFRACRAPKFPKKLAKEIKGVDMLMYHYKVSYSTALEYIKMIPLKELNKMKKTYTGFDFKEEF